MALTMLATFGLLGAASALALGGANITPGYLSLGFFLIAVAIRRDAFDYALLSLKPGAPGIVLLILTAWVVCSCFLLPRLFAGQFMVFPLNSQTSLAVEIPIYPVSSNINQAVYFIGGTLLFFAVSSIIRNDVMMRRAAGAVIITSAISLVFAVIDSMTFYLGMSGLLSFVRNADYAQLFGHSVMGIKRVTAFFPEASTYGFTACGFFAFNFKLWRSGIRPQLTGFLALATFVSLMISFSSTAYVALMAYFAVVLLGITYGRDRRKSANPVVAAMNERIFLSLIPLGMLLTAVIIALKPDILDPIIAVFDRSITSKLSSDSGVERTAWNMGGIRVFFESFGLGAGLGSVRTSSFPIDVLANLGVVGAILFSLFFYTFFKDTGRHPFHSADRESMEYAAAAKSGCFIMLLGGSVTGGVGLGINFYLMAGIACASLFYVDARKRNPIPPEPLAKTTLAR